MAITMTSLTPRYYDLTNPRYYDVTNFRYYDVFYPIYYYVTNPATMTSLTLLL